MKTIFKFDESKRMLTAYELGNKDLANHVIRKFLEGYEFDGFGREEIYRSSSDEGYRSLYFGNNDEIFLQRQVDKQYLGMFQQSNIGVAGHGCDHYYEDTYSYTYSRELLPKDIMAALNCMYNTIYYGDYSDYSVVKEERALFDNAKRYLDIATTPVNYEEYNENNVDMVRSILNVIRVERVANYSIAGVEDLIEIFEKYHHPIQYVISLYGYYNHKFASLKEFYASLDANDGDWDDKKYRRFINEVFQAFSMTPEWLKYIDEVKAKNSQLIRRRNIII